MPTFENAPELIAEAKARVQRSTPTLSDDDWNKWLAYVSAHGGQIVLQPDGARAEYPLTDF